MTDQEGEGRIGADLVSAERAASISVHGGTVAGVHLTAYRARTIATFGGFIGRTYVSAQAAQRLGFKTL